jgi:hypothetical protein
MKKVLVSGLVPIVRSTRSHSVWNFCQSLPVSMRPQPMAITVSGLNPQSSTVAIDSCLKCWLENW